MIYHLKKNTVISEPVSQPDDTALRLIIQGVTVEITNQATQSAIQNTLSVLRYLESERFCDWCNAEMVSVSSKFVREEIRITPAKVERIRYMQEVLVCPECHKDYDGSFKSGIVPKALIPHSPASASAVAYVMF